MHESVYSAQSVPSAALKVVLEDERLRWVYAERMEDIVLTWCQDWLNSPIPLECWCHGRAFGPELEVSWWRRDDSYDVRSIVVAGDRPRDIAWVALDTKEWQRDAEQTILLTGEHDTDRSTCVPTWSAARIPRYLPYPVEVGEMLPRRVGLVQCVYRVSGVIVTERLIRVQEVINA
jgi:hypothetical protein